MISDNNLWHVFVTVQATHDTNQISIFLQHKMNNHHIHLSNEIFLFTQALTKFRFLKIFN